jgi:hypothetical protein
MFVRAGMHPELSAMSERIHVTTTTETLVLMRSARRCALCFGFHGDLRLKKGQIAHVDRNPSNADEKNLAYLCLEHHDEYDSKTSQVKGITEAELRGYNERLLEAIANEEHLSTITPLSKVDAIRSHDERVFRQADELMSEKELREVLGQLQSDDSYLMSQARRIDSFRSFFTETGNQFIDEAISEKLRALITNLDSLLTFLGIRFFVYPTNQDMTEDVRSCLHPNFNVDRDGDGTFESMKRYDDLQKMLDKVVEEARNAYQEYRRGVKHYLHI